MTDKKRLDFGETIFIITLIVFIAISISWITIREVVSKDFTITHYTNSPCYYYVSDDKIKVHEIGNRNVTVLQNLEKEEIILYDENTRENIHLCKIIEVDELKWYRESWEGHYQAISKQDLTTEWLDENAECVEKYNKGKNALCSLEITNCENFQYDSCLK